MATVAKPRIPWPVVLVLFACGIADAPQPAASPDPAVRDADALTERARVFIAIGHDMQKLRIPDRMEECDDAMRRYQPQIISIREQLASVTGAPLVKVRGAYTNLDQCVSCSALALTHCDAAETLLNKN